MVVGANQKDMIPSIVGVDVKTNSILALDGHVYNADFLATKYGCNVPRSPGKLERLDATALLAGYFAIGIDIFKEAIGSFSGILKDGETLIGFRDPIGGKPLYVCDTDSFLLFASELKALSPLQETIVPLNPGQVFSSREGAKKYFDFKSPQNSLPHPITEDFYANKIRELLKNAVRDNICPGEHVCALLSGGIDSTIVVSLAKDLIKNLHAYTVAVEGSNDLAYAQRYTKAYNLPHTIVTITIDDLLKMIPDVIYALETFDAALIRSAIPMFIISKKMNEDEKPDVVLTGEGGDELFGGYDYLKALSNEQEFNRELLNLLEIEHKTGLQRVDRIPYHFSIEARAPLFDRRLVEFSFQIPHDLKIREVGGKKIEKYILRRAFEKDIPPDFVWREKEKFSKGVGSQFFLRDYFQNHISDEEFESEKRVTDTLVVRSKEELYFWRIFNSKFHPTPATISQLGFTSSYEI
ncbi:MAG: asparagine synthase [Promethearchaeota archaeon CR_4]|nr:MAG: asparagine synthase [Candidatus Lokiarchaeota archaeon CR_4]